MSNVLYLYFTPSSGRNFNKNDGKLNNMFGYVKLFINKQNFRCFKA